MADGAAACSFNGRSGISDRGSKREKKCGAGVCREFLPGFLFFSFLFFSFYLILSFFSFRLL